jgi:hypothetical protein
MKNYLFIDQYGNQFKAKSITALKRDQGIAGRIFPIFVDRGNKVIKVGHGIGHFWFTKYQPVEEIQS